MHINRSKEKSTWFYIDAQEIFDKIQHHDKN